MRARKARMTASGKQSMLPSTPCWIRSTLVWTTWRRRTTTSMPASRSCWSPIGRHAWNSSNSLGRPLVMPAPRCREPPTRPHPYLSRPCSGLARYYLA
uniref:Bublin coiled coil protein n=2 Tax=Rattus norvegicus TaxID=10116 RepID=D3ZBT2_RAT